MDDPGHEEAQTTYTAHSKTPSQLLVPEASGNETLLEKAQVKGETGLLNLSRFCHCCQNVGGANQIVSQHNYYILHNFSFTRRLRNCRSAKCRHSAFHSSF